MNIPHFTIQTGTHEPFTDGPVYEPWTNGYSVGFKVTSTDGQVEFIYLNPSGSYDRTPDVFLYKGPTGEPCDDEPMHYYVPFDYVPFDD